MKKIHFFDPELGEIKLIEEGMSKKKRKKIERDLNKKIKFVMKFMT